MKKVAIQTLGCKVNSYESDSVIANFVANGYELVNFNEVADVYIINTCTVTNSGDSKSRKEIRKCIKLNSEATVCVIGCYSQTNPDEILAIDGVDIILGTSERDKLHDLVEEFINENQQINKVQDIFKVTEFENINETVQSSKTRAFLKIQEGCNNFCSYCIIPYARGRMRSKKPERVIGDLNELIAKGFNEVVLTGIHTGGYGADLENFKFDDLLEKIVSEMNERIRIRISSIEINQLSPRILKLMQENDDIFVPHFHVPIQAGSNEILKLMRRHYDVEEYLNKLAEIRSYFPHAAITTDIIVGFPGETDEMFATTIETVKSANFSEMHVFPYSKRNGTPAAKMKEQIHGDIKRARAQELAKLNEKLANDYIEKFENKTLKVLFEVVKEDHLVGHSENYILVKAKLDKAYLNKVVEIKLTEAKYHQSFGELN